LLKVPQFEPLLWRTPKTLQRKELRRLFMEKIDHYNSLVLFPFLMKTARPAAYGAIVIVFLTGCTATVVRWNSIKMREEIMAYYNDEIMDNLIRMKEGLPFVHVDISSVSAQGISQVSGTVGGGDTENLTRTSPSMIGALHTISRVATAPFAYSVTPLHNDTLTMTAAPVIGPLPADSEVAGSSCESPKLEITKVTEVRKPPREGEEEGELKERTVEKTPRKPATTTIYEIYKDFLDRNPKALECSDLQPSKDKFVPGTKKRHGTGYCYITNEGNNNAEYTKLCTTLFTHSRGKSSAKTLETDVEALKAQGTLIPSTGRP